MLVAYRGVIPSGLTQERNGGRLPARRTPRDPGSA
jgi:hypothetical protein